MIAWRWGCWLPIFSSLVLSLWLDARIRADDSPRMVGIASCATATCHGGLSGVGPAWHSSASVWQATDPHVGAGEVLWSIQSQQIVQLLNAMAVASEEQYVDFLQSRCVSCHAPMAARVADRPDSLSDVQWLRTSMAAGVSCEACHGPASQWIGPHTRQAWRLSDGHQDSRGMLTTKTLFERTENCARCHVGSRTADGLIRDMNHDMIAAGHPPLYFDMVQYQQQLPAHWDPASESLNATPAVQFANTSSAMRFRVLGVAIQLSLRRTEMAEQLPSPEFSEFDCSACHHSLRGGGPRAERPSFGTALWQPWYTTGLYSPSGRAQLRLNQPNLAPMLRELADSVEEQAQRITNGPEIPPRVQLQRLLFASRPTDQFDFCGAAIWLDQLETTSQVAFALPSAESLLDESSRRISQFRTHVLGIHQQPPEVLDKLLTQPWSQADLERWAQDLADCLGLETEVTRP